MSLNTVIFTGSSLRHKAFAEKARLSKKLKIKKVFYERGSLLKKIVQGRDNNFLEKSHLIAREQCEKDTFQWFLSKSVTSQASNLDYVERDWFSSEKCLREINDLNPDLILVYGTSILKGNIVSRYKGKILNIHLGLSPYYRGSGTNYFPFVNNEPEYCGATIMFLDQGVDTGEIIHQIRPQIYEVDSFHQLSNRFLLKAFEKYIEVAEYFPNLENKLDYVSSKKDFKYYRKTDFNDLSVKKLYKNFKEGMISNYLDNKYERDKSVPIVQNPLISS